MKKIVFTILFATLFVACDKDTGDNNLVTSPNSTPDLTQIRIKERPSETLEFIGEIGVDFDTALDSLRKIKHIPSEITKQPLEVLFDYDNRSFFGIVYDFGKEAGEIISEVVDKISCQCYFVRF